MNIQLTDEQNAIIARASQTTDNFVVVARAGAAKTTALEHIAGALPNVDILCLAFNKKIAEEMTTRLPDNCTASTLHSLGFAAWRQFLSTRCQVRTNKIYTILQTLIETLSQEEKEEAYEDLSDTMQIISTGKNSGWVPEAYKGNIKRVCSSDDDFFLSLPRDPSPLQQELVLAASELSFKEAMKGILDFDDMILCPAVGPVSFPSPSLTLIDEAQDLSHTNHVILKKIVRNRRIIAVGDPLQAIYGFRGASVTSIADLTKMFNLDELKLTTSFRCSRAVCENVSWIAPDMNSPEWATEGSVTHLEVWDMDIFQPGDAIICRNNAPLFRVAINLIAAGKRPELSGRDLAKPLVKIMKKLGKPSTPTPITLHALEDWKKGELKKARPGAAGYIHDMAACLTVIFTQVSTIKEAQNYLEALLSQRGSIKLMTGHKSKGLEFPRVFFLNPGLCNLDHEQDANIKYVIETRAKNDLIYINQKGCVTDPE